MATEKKEFEIITAQEADTKFSLTKTKKVFDLEVAEEFGIKYFKGNIRLKDLDLDPKYEENNQSLIIDGNLFVEENISNLEIDYGLFLYVTGNVTAKNIVAGGSVIQIDGNAEVKNTIFVYYNHGRLTIKGTATAKNIISREHATYLKNVKASIYYDNSKHKWNLSRIVKEEFIEREEDDGLEYEQDNPDDPLAFVLDDIVARAVYEGKPFLRDDAEQIYNRYYNKS